MLPEPQILRLTVQELLNYNCKLPECQREKEWDDDMYANLIDSMSKNIDIGQIIININDEDEYYILDGQHRLEAITKFYNKKLKINIEEDVILNKKITICQYKYLTKEQQTLLYSRINVGVEQNDEHLEKLQDINNMKQYIEQFTDKINNEHNRDIVINSILYILYDYYYNGEANVVIKNLTKKNHFIKHIVKLNSNFDNYQSILDITKYLINEIFADNGMSRLYARKIKNYHTIAIIYHIFHENYNDIKNKTFKFTNELDNYYCNIIIDLNESKLSKVKDIFNEIVETKSSE
jgi:hypothetical protein